MLMDGGQRDHGMGQDAVGNGHIHMTALAGALRVKQGRQNAHHRRHAVGEGDEAREFLSMPWTSQAPDGSLRSYFIWGATAAMLRNFYRFLAA
jgi:hypothetical protein